MVDCGGGRRSAIVVCGVGWGCFLVFSFLCTYRGIMGRRALAWDYRSVSFCPAEWSSSVFCQYLCHIS